MVAKNPSAGVFFHSNKDGDFRGRTENVFDRALGESLKIGSGGGYFRRHINAFHAGGMPLRRIALSVGMRGSSHPETWPSCTSLSSLRLLNTV